jgi:hypothetical protein
VITIDEYKLHYHRPRFYEKQRAAIFDPKRISVIEASTKSGKTSGAIAWLVEQALFGHSGWNLWWVAPVSEQAAIAFRRMCSSVPREMYIASLSHPQHIRLLNGTTVWFKSGDKPDSLYGEDVYAAVVDEASRTKEQAWIALRSTLTYTRGPIRIIGNVRGRKNWFFNLARQAERGDPEMAYHKIIAADAVAAGVLDEKEVADARTQMPESAWRELYLAEPSDEGGNPFGEQHIRGCIVAGLSPEPPAWWGWDLAKSQNYTVGCALDKSHRLCRFERWQGIAWEVTINRMISMVGRTPALVDSTGVGDPIVERLQQQGGQNFEGYQFSQGSKQKLMEGLAVAIQSHNVSYPDGVLAQELLSFEYEVTRTGVRYTAAEGGYDDCVMALSLAVMCSSLIPAQMKIPKEVLQRLRRMGPINQRQGLWR